MINKFKSYFYRRFKTGLMETRRPRSSDRETVNLEYNQLFHPEHRRGEYGMNKKCSLQTNYSLQEEYVTKTKKESSNPFRKLLKSKSLKTESFDGDLDLGDLTLFGSMTIIECSCGHNSCPNCNLTYM